MPRILIIDDEIQNLKALNRALGDENPDWQILTARTEVEGKSILQRQFHLKLPIDVVLTDLVMDSEQSGMNVLQEARAIDPLVMAILFTAKEKSLDRYAAFDYGAFDVVEKNIRGAAAHREINIKTRAALRYREWSQRINFLRRYFDPRVFELIQKDSSLLALNKKILTIVFWDIRGFSKLCEILKAHGDLIAGFLSDYFDSAARAIFDNSGIVDKFIGDGVMALFGILSSNDDGGKSDAISAVTCAMALRDEFAKLQRKWLTKWELYVPDRIEISLGCGIHTGEVLFGNVGTDFRDQYTALGPNVNFAARLEARSGPQQILISQSTEARTRGAIDAMKAGRIDDIKNIPGTFEVYSV